MQTAQAASSSSAAPSSWQERIAGGRITTAPPAFSKDGDFLITCAATVLKVYSIKTGEVVKALRHKSRVTGFFFNPANALQLYSVAYDGIIRLWDFEDGVLLKSWKIGGEGQIEQAVLDVTHRVAYLHIKKKDAHNRTAFHISTFNLQNQTSRVRYSSNMPLGKLYVSPRGDFFAAIFENQLGFHLFNVNSLTKQVIRHSHKITSFDFHPIEPCVAYGDETGVVRVNYCLPIVPAAPTGAGMDLADDTPAVQQQQQQQQQNSAQAKWHSTRIDKYEWHTTAVSALQFSSDGFYLFSGGLEEVLVLWRLGTITKVFIPRMGAAISSVTLNEQGTAYAVCCNDNSIRIINASSRDMVMRIQGISLQTRTLPIRIEPYTGLIVTSFNSNSLQLYDPIRDKHVDKMEIVSNPQVFFDKSKNLPMAAVKHVAYGPKGVYMVTTDHRGKTDIDAEINIKFWKHDGRQYVLDSVAQQAHQQEITAVACHPILPLVASCSTDGKFKIWEQVEKPAPPGSKHKDVVRTMWVCRSVGDFKGLPASGLSFSTDGSLLAVAYKSTITLWDPMSSAFHRSLTFTNAHHETIKHLAFVPSSRYLVSATSEQLFVWDLLRCAVVWSCNLKVQSVVVDTAVNYKANLVFPSPSSLVSSFVVTDGEYIFLFNPASPKPMNVWKVDKCMIMSMAFAATSSLLPEGRIVYLNDKCELVYLEKKLDKKTNKNQDTKKVSLSMSEVKNATKKEQKLTAFENAFGKLSLAKDQTAGGVAQPPKAEDVGILVPREDTGALFNPTAPQLSHLFNGPSHLLPSPVKIYSSFMEGLLKKAHTQVATATTAAAADDAASGEKGVYADNAGDSAMQLDESSAPATKRQPTAAAASDANTSKNQQKRHNKATEKMFYDSMFKFFSSYAARDGEDAEMPASLLNELTASVQQPRSAKHDHKKGQQNGVEQAKADEAKTTTTPAEQKQDNATPTKSQARKKKRASVAGKKAAAEEGDVMMVEENDDNSSGPREEPAQANGTDTTKTDKKAPRRRRKSTQNGSQE